MDSIMCEIGPVDSDGVEMLKMIMTPYNGKLIQHLPDRDVAIVEFPDASSVEGIREIPSYNVTELADYVPEKSLHPEPHSSSLEECQETSPVVSPVNVPVPSRPVFPSNLQQTLVKDDLFCEKRTPLPSNDIFYLFSDINIVVPGTFIYLVTYTFFALFDIF